MKLGQTAATAAAAYNQYEWPTTLPTVGQQLTAVTVAGVTTLGWAAPYAIPWTAKGQLIVGTGSSTDTLLNVGSNTSFLVADSGATSGLAYTNTLKSAVLLPVGNDTGDRPASPIVGQVRYNSTSNEFEGYSGSTPIWQPLGGQPTGGGSDKIFFTNSQVVTTNYTLPIGKNAVTAGNITVNAGVTVTISAGSSWAIV
jgi:hypothetical protein